MAWAVSAKKPFFVGLRSIEMRRRHPSKRKLVGFTLPKSEAVPEESNLVLTGEAVTGFVTSAALSEACGCVLGLAYAPADAEEGKTITIKYTNGRRVEATVVAPHFYDPENKRQEL